MALPSVRLLRRRLYAVDLDYTDMYCVELEPAAEETNAGECSAEPAAEETNAGE